MIWAPISEVYGRRMGMLPAIFVLGLFSIGTATSKNAESIFLTRFFGGIFASAPISNVPAALGDLFPPASRGNAMTFVTLCISGGPTVGPLLGSAFVVNPSLGWRCNNIPEFLPCRVSELTMFHRDGIPREYPCVLCLRALCLLFARDVCPSSVEGQGTKTSQDNGRPEILASA